MSDLHFDACKNIWLLVFRSGAAVLKGRSTHNVDAGRAWYSCMNRLLGPKRMLKMSSMVASQLRLEIGTVPRSILSEKIVDNGGMTSTQRGTIELHNWRGEAAWKVKKLYSRRGLFSILSGGLDHFGVPGLGKIPP
eukprot:5004061-Amphidinium_carterae.1